MWSRCVQGKFLKDFSTLGIGGPAKWLFEARSIEDLQGILKFTFTEKIPHLIVGKGSNFLFDDRGFDGLVILNKISSCEQVEERWCVGAGYSFSLLGAQTAKKGWSGLEFASGIPGSVGGAVFMNAGANGQETSHRLEEVTYVTEEGGVRVFDKHNLEFSYRFSSFQQMRGSIAQAVFVLEKNLGAREKQLEIIDYRMLTQPYGDKSIGCVFRNPKDFSAGALIEQCGLKGLKIGGAEVSMIHGNFLVNKKEATAKNILDLAYIVKERVYELTGIELEMEIQIANFNSKEV